MKRKEMLSVNIIVCFENSYGMMFNNRRVSRDSVVINDIISCIGTGKLYMNPYSATLFDDEDIELCVNENFLDMAGENDFCFIENKKLIDYKPDIFRVITYSWNRDYPSDMKCDIINYIDDSFDCVAVEDFEGSSHSKVTKKIYIKRGVKK